MRSASAGGGPMSNSGSMPFSISFFSTTGDGASNRKTSGRATWPGSLRTTMPRWPSASRTKVPGG